MELRIRSRAVAIAVMICLAMVGNSGCAQSMLSGQFVNHDNPVEVDMLRLVESPPGHLSGSLVVSSLNTDGSRKKDATYDVTGTITRPNVSLQLEGGLVGLAEFFGASTNLVGSLRGETLTLSAGNQTEVFYETSQKQYDAVLTGLDEAGHHVALVRQAFGAVQGIEANDQQLNADLTKYIAWGQERINHVSGVRDWYADRAARYTKCLQTIRPLAAQGIPSWRWQSCALAVENDKYYRDQETQSIRELQGKNKDTTAGLDARIDAAQHQFPKVLDELKSACPYAKDVGACEKELQKLTSLPPDGLLDSHLIASYRSIVPQVDAAISEDLQTATTGQSNLATIADEVEKVYRSAR
jgi:hypothetical protein